MKQGSSGLTLRDCQVDHKSAFELTPRKVAQWVKNLPIANLGESSKSTYRLLVDANHTLIDPDKRLSILNTIEPVVSQLTIALEKQFIKNHITLSDKQKKIAALVQAIQTELAIGYHSVIESIVTGEIKRSHKKVLASALTLAIKYHGLVILRCYQLYTSIPSRIWRELYNLYQIASLNELENQTLQDDSAQEKISSHSYFVRILLLSTANPYQLRQQEIQLLWRLLPELGEHATLMSHAYNKQHFIVSLNSSQPPVHKSLYKPKENSNNLKLTAFTIVDHLKKMLDSNTEQGQLNARKTMLLRHLIQCWSHGTHRSFARTPCNETLDISIGLGATHYLQMEHSVRKENEKDISGSIDELEIMEGSLRDATLIDAAPVLKEDLGKSVDYLSSTNTPDRLTLDKLFIPGEIIKPKPAPVENHNRSRDSIAKDSYQLHQVDLLNMSPGGYCIQITVDDLPKHAQTGEILGILEAESTDHWSIGVVRWVRRHSKGSIVQMGVQLLAPGALPINIQLRNSKIDKNEFQRALILPALTGIGQPATLLTNPLSFETKSKVRIMQQGLEYDARLTKEIASSSSFRQFQFDKLSDEKSSNEVKKPVKNPTFDPNELEGVWDLI